MSALIRTPSHTVLPDGDVTFIVYRGDIASARQNGAAGHRRKGG
jgi:hypothetical protein